jgi:hypothetical protein
VGAAASLSRPLLLPADTTLSDLADHAGQLVRVGGFAEAIAAASFVIDDGTASATVRLVEARAAEAEAVRPGDLVNVTGEARTGETGEAEIVVTDADDQGIQVAASSVVSSVTSSADRPDHLTSAGAAAGAVGSGTADGPGETADGASPSRPVDLERQSAANPGRERVPSFVALLCAIAAGLGALLARRAIRCMLVGALGHARWQRLVQSPGHVPGQPGGTAAVDEVQCERVFDANGLGGVLARAAEALRSRLAPSREEDHA